MITSSVSARPKINHGTVAEKSRVVARKLQERTKPDRTPGEWAMDRDIPGVFGGEVVLDMDVKKNHLCHGVKRQFNSTIFKPLLGTNDLQGTTIPYITPILQAKSFAFLKASTELQMRWPQGTPQYHCLLTISQMPPGILVSLRDRVAPKLQDHDQPTGSLRSTHVMEKWFVSTKLTVLNWNTVLSWQNGGWICHYTLTWQKVQSQETLIHHQPRACSIFGQICGFQTRLGERRQRTYFTRCLCLAGSQIVVIWNDTYWQLLIPSGKQTWILKNTIFNWKIIKTLVLFNIHHGPYLFTKGYIVPSWPQCLA